MGVPETIPLKVTLGAGSKFYCYDCEDPEDDDDEEDSRFLLRETRGDLLVGFLYI